MSEFEQYQKWLKEEKLQIRSPKDAWGAIVDHCSINIHFLNTKNRIEKVIGISADASIQTVTEKMLHETQSSNCSRAILYIPRSITPKEHKHITKLSNNLENTIGIDMLDILQKDDDGFTWSYQEDRDLQVTDVISDKELIANPIIFELNNHIKNVDSDAFKQEQKRCFLNQLEEFYPDMLHVNREEIVETCQNMANSPQEIFTVVDIYEAKVSTRYITKGTINSTVVSPKDVFNYNEKPKGMILMHNHPSGQTEPSKDDIKTTKRFLETAQVLGIELYEHLIVGKAEIGRLSETAKNLEFSNEQIKQQHEHQSSIYDLYDFCHVNREDIKHIFKIEKEM